MADVAGNLVEVSRQFSAMLNSLLASDSHQAGISANVQRRNGLEAGRRIAEPINEDKAHIRRDLAVECYQPQGGDIDGRQ